MAHDNKVVRITGQKPVGRFSQPPALIRLRDASGQSLKAVLSSFFEQADDSLFALADRAGSNQDQTAYFDAMRELRLRRKSMTVSMLQYVSQAFNDIGRFKPLRSASSLEEVDQDSLSLLDHSELEQQVAIENLVTKLRNQYQEPVRMLATRVRHLMPGIELSDDQMPLSPEVICGGVSEACADLDIDIRAKLVVLKLFERLLVNKLAGFYEQANKTLIAEGVLPDMKRPPTGKGPVTGHRAPQGQGPVPPASAGSAGASASYGEQAGASQSPTFSELSALLHQGDAAVSGGGVPLGAVTLDTGNLMVRLNELQSSFQGHDGDQVIPLRQQIVSVLQEPGGKSVSFGQVDGDVINLVSMLFDFILEDRQLHSVMKSLIGRLQIPVLKVALSDRNFFNRGGHPVRKLLNELALSAIGWTEKRAGMRDPLREKIEEVVDRILNEFTDNVGLFEALLKDFGHFMDLDRRRRELVEQRLRDAEEGRARQERAIQAATSLINDESAGRDIPAPVMQILSEPWTRYLQWVVLRQGEDSEQWQSASVVTQRLIWSVDPAPVSDATRSELLRAIPGVVEELRRALHEISWDPFSTDAVIRDLELAHVDVFQKLVTAPVAEAEEVRAEPAPVIEGHAEAVSGTLSVETVRPISEPVPIIDEAGVPAAARKPEQEVVPAAQNVSPAPVASAEWLDRADHLRVGSWVELVRDGVKVRCKLAAFIKATGKYIFVNRSGAKVAEYHRNDLATALQGGFMTLLDDGLIFDRALESIIDNLRHNRKD
ncbi:DUF1631 domain-containing protein [Marinobacter halophilus]|uniref:DUF1631 domain-containing protein n=1 Tax=Marinobacter halophilus TaxID=1323740 RepID=A0A2T1KHZ3_9GAMM|nr:DUF1631 domain-containing protein [Marinobacter halophilus]PSF09759.1 DUF1631 domain-containing protein [Marinobacter halophilus]GGC79550.1 hypothetical protein GCM10011362_30260 [Marinobacter halophilus]